MTDSLGYRMKFGVIAPSTNTSVQPEFDEMRPAGVTNHFARIRIPDMKVASDRDFNNLVKVIERNQYDAVDSVMTCSPGYLIMGMSAETFWGGADAAAKLKVRMEKRAGVGVTMGSEACEMALATYSRHYARIRRIAVITPYMPVGDRNVVRFFTDIGYEVVAVKGLKCRSPMLIAHTSRETLRDAIVELNTSEVQAIVQVGTNLAMAHLAPAAEIMIKKPVIAINTAIYWHALRKNRIKDRVRGFGTLLERH
ncbi:MAG: arylmalonate decarboxylase [Alphaproteobacteria bacterium]